MRNSALAAKPFALFLAAGLLSAGGGCLGETPRSAPPANAAKTPPGANWMRDHLDSWGKRPLKRWVLPAAHDASIYETGWIKSLARTQDLTIYEQLNYGIRYFDLRPQWADGEFYMHHGPVLGPKVADVLGDVRRFCREGHRELIVLKFSHYEGFDDQVFGRLVAAIHERLEPWLYKSLPQGKRLAEIPLAELLREHAVVWPVCDGGYSLAKPSPGVWVYREWYAAHPEQGDLRVFDQYADSTDYKKMKADQLGKFTHYDGRCKERPELPCDLFLLSWTLTPPTDVRGYSALPNRKLVDDMKDLRIPNHHDCIPNLLYTDYVETARSLDAALSMNESLTKVKETKNR